MSTRTLKNVMTLGAAGAIAIAVASPSRAAPLLLNVAATRTAGSSPVTDIRYCGHGYCPYGYGRPYWGTPYYPYLYPYRHSTSYPSPYIYSYNPFSFPVPYPRPYLYPFGYAWGRW